MRENIEEDTVKDQDSQQAASDNRLHVAVILLSVVGVVIFIVANISVVLKHSQYFPFAYWDTAMVSAGSKRVRASEIAQAKQNDCDGIPKAETLVAEAADGNTPDKGFAK